MSLLSQCRKDLNACQAQVVSLQGTVASLQAQNTALTEQVDGLVATNQAQAASIDNLEGSVAQQEQQLASQAQQITDLQAQIADLEVQLDDCLHPPDPTPPEPVPVVGVLFGGTGDNPAQFNIAGRSYVNWLDRTSDKARARIAQLVPAGEQSIRLINFRFNGPGEMAPVPDVLSGAKDADMAAWCSIVDGYQAALVNAGLNRALVLTNWHEPRGPEDGRNEFTYPNATEADWGRVFAYVMDFCEGWGLRDVYWTTCFTGAEYTAGTADRYVGGLLSHPLLWAVGVDAYGDNSKDTADKALASMIEYATVKGEGRIVVCETAAREPDSGAWHLEQGPWYDSLWALLKSDSRFLGCFLWTAKGDNFHNELEPDGAASVAAFAADAYSLSVVPL